MTEPKKHKETAVDSSAVQPSRRNFLKFGASGIAAATLSTRSRPTACCRLRLWHLRPPWSKTVTRPQRVSNASS